MYEAFFGLQKRPFASVPQVDAYFPASTIEAARQTLVRCIDRGEGVGMVVGPSGTGKTLLCQLLARQFEETLEIVQLPSGRLSSRRALFQAMLYEMGRPYRGMDEGELRLAIIDYLTLSESRPEALLLLVDEAHTLPLRLLEEVRMLTNLARDGQPQARLVLAGGSLLEEHLASPKLESFSQRIVARCYLESLNRTETEQYIEAQTRGAGQSDVFSHEACEAVYLATDGVPRLVNQVCDHALLLAYSEGRENVEKADVEEAWSDLQQLPTPWNGDEEDDDYRPSLIEFGRLDDDGDDLDRSSESDEETDEEEMILPALRVARHLDETTSGPIEKLERIQEAISELNEEDFQPVGSIGTEVELVFDDLGDPLGEPFEEEEVVHARRRPGQEDEEPRPISSPEPEPGDAERVEAVAEESHETVPLSEIESSLPGPASDDPAHSDEAPAEMIAEESHQTIPFSRIQSALPEAAADERVSTNPPGAESIVLEPDGELEAPNTVLIEPAAAALVEAEERGTERDHFTTSPWHDEVGVRDVIAQDLAAYTVQTEPAVLTPLDVDAFGPQITASDADDPRAAVAEVAPTPATKAEARAERDSGPHTVPMHRMRPVDEPEQDEDDVIVVEDGYDEVEPPHRPPTRPVTPVRPQEYRRLFAKLRRSS